MDTSKNFATSLGIRPHGIKKKRTRLCDRVLPDYTKGEEIFNTVTHIVGGSIGVITLVLCVLKSVLAGNVTGTVCGAVFGASMIILYAMSSIYHGLRPCTAKKVFQIFDHCTIYLLIAGTYTPMLLCALVKESPVTAFAIFGIIWGLTALSITLTAIDIEKYKIFGMISYIGMGWAIIFSVKPMIASIGAEGFYWLLAGGIFYTVGVLFFRFGKKIRYFHSIFHIFVLFGSIAHSLCVLLFVM